MAGRGATATGCVRYRSRTLPGEFADNWASSGRNRVGWRDPLRAGRAGRPAVDEQREAWLWAVGRRTVDRLTFEAHIIETDTQSFRLTSTTAKRKAAAA
ncbi:hypothetical protein TNCT6_59960 [Streptomyces sp. 6-11-2]|nr:hypothetical protein TNCT6_59960 [Streptomyces sp. 6-11-2]